MRSPQFLREGNVGTRVSSAYMRGVKPRYAPALDDFRNLAWSSMVATKPNAVMTPTPETDMRCRTGMPAGVFNLVNGDGPTVGDAMSRHPGIDMTSFTGSASQSDSSRP